MKAELRESNLIDKDILSTLKLLRLILITQTILIGGVVVLLALAE